MISLNFSVAKCTPVKLQWRHQVICLELWLIQPERFILWSSSCWFLSVIGLCSGRTDQRLFDQISTFLVDPINLDFLLLVKSNSRGRSVKLSWNSSFFFVNGFMCLILKLLAWTRNRSFGMPWNCEKLECPAFGQWWWLVLCLYLTND